MKRDQAAFLQQRGINPSAQRVAVAQYVLHTEDHPSADEVWTRVRKRFPHVSRATVYNTLNLFVEKGLLRQFVLTEGRVVFDPKIEDHHHFRHGRYLDAVYFWTLSITEEDHAYSNCRRAGKPGPADL